MMKIIFKLFALFAVTIAHIPSEGTAAFDMYDSIMNAFNGAKDEQFERPTTYDKRFNMPFSDDAMKQWYNQQE